MASAVIRGKVGIAYTMDEPLQGRDGKWTVCYQESGDGWKPFFTNRYEQPHEATLAAMSNILIALGAR